MSDRSYNGGITVESVINMLDDIHGVYAGTIKYVRLPQPIEGVAPADRIKFSKSSKIKSEKLLRSISISGSKTPSRRVLSHRLSNTGDDGYIRQERSSVNRNIDSINVKIDDAIRFAGGNPIVEENPVVESDHEADTMNHRSYHTDVPMPTRRRIPIKRPAEMN